MLRKGHYHQGADRRLGTQIWQCRCHAQGAGSDGQGQKANSARLLGQGSERAAKVWGNGADECLITVKGAEAPAHMPQAKRSLALIYAVNPFGADHQSSEHDPYYEEGVGDFNFDRLKADWSWLAAACV